MQIPKQFELAGQTINVVREKDLLVKSDCVWETRYRRNEIAIQTSSEEREMKEGELTERCWKGYTQKGMKTMFGKRYPNCVKKTKKWTYRNT